MIGGCAAHQARDLRRVTAVQGVHGQDDLELVVEGQERLEKVLLRPEEPNVKQPARIVPRQEDVVEVDKASWRKRRGARRG